jgi:uncharacterized protein YjbI with pentapeptide repeats
VADEQQLAVLRRGSDAWNDWWYQQKFAVKLDLSKAVFSGAELAGAVLSGADFFGAHLTSAKTDGGRPLRRQPLRGESLEN